MPYQPSYEVTEDRQAYTMLAGRVGCLMLHGFMGSPISSRPMAHYLAERGITMHCPLLPGHGEMPNKLYKVRKEDWMAEAEEALDFMRQHCEEIFLMGHSMGTILGAQLIIQNEDIRGQIMLAPVYDVPDSRIRLMRFVRHVMPWFYPLWIKSLHELVYQRVLDYDPTLDLDDPDIQAKLPEMTRLPTSSMDEMRQVIDMGRDLWPRLDLPEIIFQGGQDVAVDSEKTQTLFNLLLNQDKQYIFIEESGHELMRPFDPEHERVWTGAYDFIRTHSSLELTATSGGA
jgi:carboxylesterase